MDKEVGLKQYSYLSRYTSVPLMHDAKGNQYHGTVKWTEETTGSTYKVKVGDTLEKIALAYYGNPNFWWVVADANRILDPFEELEEGRVLKIISLNDIKFTQRAL